jgi:hypothetical protein
MLHGFLLA